MTDPLKPLRAQILPKQVSPKPLHGIRGVALARGGHDEHHEPLARQATGIEAVHGEDVDGRAAAALRLAADTLGGVHRVPSLRGVEHEKAAAARLRRRRRLRGRGRHGVRTQNPRPASDRAASNKQRSHEATQSLRRGHPRSCRRNSRAPVRSCP
uniref:Uncharacterized protein n=1 Tax=Arundo donax TaxID=35708 RepID=A0A0A9D624_ARUDO